MKLTASPLGTVPPSPRQAQAICECGAVATRVTTWKTPAMWGPAFWYDCEECYPKTVGVLARDANVTATTRIL